MNTGRLSTIYIIAGLILIAAGIPLKNTCLGFYIALSSIILIGAGILLHVAGIAGRPSTPRIAVSYLTLGLLALISQPFLPAPNKEVLVMLSFTLVFSGLLFTTTYLASRLYTLVRRIR